MHPVIDVHCHIYPEKIAVKATRGISTFYGGINIRHIGSPAELVKTAEEQGITHSVIFSVATTPGQVNSINSFISSQVDFAMGSLSGLGAIHPDTENIDEVLNNIKDLGLKGIKIHPDIHRTAIDDPRYMRIYEACSGRLPVLTHCGDYRYDFSNPDRTARVLKCFPKLQLIGAHFGGWSVWEEAAEKLSRFENLMVDTSSTFEFNPDKNICTGLINAYGEDRIMFASDFPAGDAKEDMIFLNSLPIPGTVKEKIFWKNAAEFFDIRL